MIRWLHRPHCGALLLLESGDDLNIIRGEEVLTGSLDSMASCLPLARQTASTHCISIRNSSLFDDSCNTWFWHYGQETVQQKKRLNRNFLIECLYDDNHLKSHSSDRCSRMGSILQESSPQHVAPSGLASKPIDHARPMKVICIGAGISGILTGVRFPQRLKNLDLVIYEKNEGIGGTWFENRYVAFEPRQTDRVPRSLFSSTVHA